jgi:hypothetical protein
MNAFDMYNYELPGRPSAVPSELNHVLAIPPSNSELLPHQWQDIVSRKSPQNNNTPTAIENAN